MSKTPYSITMIHISSLWQVQTIWLIVSDLGLILAEKQAAEPRTRSVDANSYNRSDRSYLSLEFGGWTGYRHQGTFGDSLTSQSRSLAQSASNNLSASSKIRSIPIATPS